MRKSMIAVMLGAAVAFTAVASPVIYSYAENMVASLDDTADSASEEETVSASDLSESYSAFSTVEMESSDETDEEFSYSSVADVAEAVMPSIVAINTTSVTEVQGWFRGETYEYETEGAGSGIIVGSNDTELLICTNNHVVEGASEVTVTFIDNESYTAQIKGTDADNDLAVVAVNLEDLSEDTSSQIKIAKIGDSDSLRIGEQVVAIGNALGYGQSVTTGIISALNRSINVSDDDDKYYNYYYGDGSNSSEEESEETTYDDLIQTDAAINPGNSGGALLNMNGEVIGINSAKASSSGVEGMGYAISITKAMPILEDLMSKQTRTKVDDDQVGYIGISGQSVSMDATQLYGIPEGIYIKTVAENSPASEAGLQEGDILTEFDGESVTSQKDLQALLQYYASGETVELTIYRRAGQGQGYTEQTVEITLGSRDSSQ